MEKNSDHFSSDRGQLLYAVKIVTQAELSPSPP